MAERPPHRRDQESRRRLPNQFEPALRLAGFNFDVPPRFHRLVDPPPKVLIDSLTTLPIEDEVMKEQIAWRLGEAIRTGESFALVFGDADNLKQANEKKDLGRLFGDMVIRYGAAQTTQALDQAEFGPNVEIIALRKGTKADETLVWIFGANEEELARTSDLLIQAGEPRRYKEDKREFDFSLSAALITSADKRVVPLLEEVKPWLLGDSTRIANRFRNEVSQIADNDVKKLKQSKDLARLPVGELLATSNIHQFRDLLVDKLGDSRISSNLLKIIIELSSERGLLALKDSVSNRAHFIVLLSGLGVTDDELRKASKPEDIQALFTKLFGEEEQGNQVYPEQTENK